MSSNFCATTRARRALTGFRLRAGVTVGCSVMFTLMSAAVRADVRFADVVHIEGDRLATFDGMPIERLGVFACDGQHCAPIPFQVDERDSVGHWVVDQGPEPNQDNPPGVLDGNDSLLFMATDAGQRTTADRLPAGQPRAEITVFDPISGAARWVYLLAFPGPAPRSATSYVDYDPSTDQVRGARVVLGFRQGVPGYLGVIDGPGAGVPNLLDRMKVRASATFLWGLIHFSRNEDDLTTQFVGWRQGPIRVIRRQRQWVRLGWGIHSVTFGSYTFFYREFAELPVGLNLNFPPTYFFGNITIKAVLDFRDLRGWSVLAPGLAAPLPIDGIMTPEKVALNQVRGSWFALLSGQVTLVEMMNLSPSLATVRRRLLYREDAVSDPPESHRGEEPGIGYQLDAWEHTGAGAHQLESISYALPPDITVRDFMAAREAPLRVQVQPLP